jgi:flagellar hook assembly protein FlgD
MMGTMADTVKDVHAFPVPFRPYGPNAGADNGQTGSEADGIRFARVPQKGEITIYTLDGQLVKKIDISGNLLQVEKTVRWDVRNTYGSKVSSGVYIWRVVSGSNSKTGKLMVIW